MGETVKDVKRSELYNGWVVCPRCGKKILKTNEKTSFNNLPLFCRKCKHVTVLNLSAAGYKCKNVPEEKSMIHPD